MPQKKNLKEKSKGSKREGFESKIHKIVREQERDILELKSHLKASEVDFKAKEERLLKIVALKTRSLCARDKNIKGLYQQIKRLNKEVTFLKGRTVNLEEQLKTEKAAFTT